MQRGLLGFAGKAAGIVVGVFALAAWPAWGWEGQDGLVGLALAGAICLVGALAGHAVRGVMARIFAGPSGAVNALTAGLGARLLVTLALALVVIMLEPFHLLPFAVWLLLYYLSLLGLEVFVALREFGQNPTHIEATGGGSEETAAAGSEESGP